MISPLTTLPLENGDQLTRIEFERRYATMSDIKKAELIEGIVYMAASRFRRHYKKRSISGFMVR
ncbi:hypothetical protein PCC9214_02009 [Planktothrix tepida]|uniref:Uncharacterized protein n=2 Tax=Planktothrix TaxID=54304 RepID=A0A1J1LLE5_9CYAN|nr:hypothetical protein PCC9214_02009 [Planktothrix tepida]CAD5969093.1 hypothetical protein NO713_03699 [Planktothrix pseudagardhii]CUR33030.1 conserved hypothetical protein [Planktothrix tepida PCC 9214]